MPAATQQVSNDFLLTLRQSTSQQHLQLESVALSQKLLSDLVTKKDYTNYLLGMFPVIQFYEEKIFPLIETEIPDIDERRKISLIEKDLAYFNIEKNKALYFDETSIKKFNQAYAFGFMYVIEGSTLGGRVILKHVKNKLGIDEENGGNFFAGYKENTSLFWKDFLQSLSAFTAKNNCADDVIEGAQTAFNLIYQHFSKQPHEY